MKNDRRGDFWKTLLTNSNIRSEHITLPEMLFGYLLGPFGASLASGIFTSILQNYFTDVLKLDLTFLTTLQLFSTILIVIANLVVGQLIEKTKALAGKARPWILLSTLTTSIASVLMFIVPFKSETAKMVWIAIAYNLFYAIAYPIYSTANSTLVSVSTRNSNERGTLASLTNVAGLGVMGAGSMVFPILVSFALKENQALWFVAFLAIAIFSALTIYLQYKFTRERITEEIRNAGKESAGEEKKAISLKDQLKAVTSEKTWWIIMLFFIFFQWSGALKNGSMSYFCKWVLDNSMLGSTDAWGVSQSILSIAGAVPMALAAIAVVPLSNRFGKKMTCFAGMIIGVAGGVIAGIGGNNIIPVAVGVALKCMGSSPACYMILAMLSDVIDHVEYKHNIRTEGLTMSIYSAIAVAGSPVMNSLFSALLKMSGYNQNGELALGIGAQTASAQQIISISYIWFETVCYAICAVLILFWTVEKNLKEEQKEIAGRNGE